MHESVLAFVRQHAQGAAAPVLEVGSANVNGSVRDLFPTPYIGVDVAEGPGVDLVVPDNKALPFGDEAFATVVSTEALEHAIDPVGLLLDMVRVLAPGGLLIVTMRGPGFPHHHPPDRWRVMPGTLAEIAQRLGLSAQESEDPQVSGRFLVATKGAHEQQATA